MGRTGGELSGAARAPRVASLDESEILSRKAFAEELAQTAARLGQSRESATAYAKQCLDEMAVHPDERYLRRVVRLARFMVSRSYHPELDVNTDRLAALKSLAQTRPLVFLWSHKSHLDSFVFLLALYENDFRPQPLSFAGINMAFPLFSTLARRSGAVFLRRSFRDDAIYRLVFRHYIDYLVESRVALSWSIEGTRSRTGKLSPPKLGLIQWVVDSFRRAACDDALLVPVSISFDQIAEIDDYTAMQRGLPKRRESLRWFIGYVGGMQVPYGRIYVRFAEPVALSESVAIPQALLGDDAERVQVRRLAFEVSSRIEHATPINATDLVTLVLLAANDRALDAGELGGLAREVLALIHERGLPEAGDLARETGPELAANLDRLTRSGLLRRRDRGRQTVYAIAASKQLAAAYYRNTIIHYFLASAVAEVALAAAGGQGEEPLREAMLELRDLLKFEFFFRAKTEFLDDGIAYLDRRFPGWRDGGGPEGTPLFGQGILRSFLESYRVLAEVLLAAGDAPREDARGLAEACLGLGEEMLLRRRIESETALSKPLFENAIRLAGHRGLLAGGAEARRRFAAETCRWLAAVHRLQDIFDRTPHGQGGGREVQ